MSEAGFVKLWRKLALSSVFQDPAAFHIFIYFLLKAQWDSETGKKIFINGKEHIMKAGQLTTGRYQISEATSWPGSTVRNALERLRSKYQILDIEADNKKSLITILNWDSYQGSETSTGQLAGQREDINRTTSGHYIKNLRIKELKNNKNIITTETKKEFLEELKKTGVYNGLNLEQEVNRAEIWLKVNKPTRHVTKRYLIYWLNKCLEKLQEIKALPQARKPDQGPTQNDVENWKKNAAPPPAELGQLISKLAEGKSL